MLCYVILYCTMRGDREVVMEAIRQNPNAFVYASKDDYPKYCPNPKKSKQNGVSSVNIDIRGEDGSPTLTTSRMTAYFTDTGVDYPKYCPNP